MTSWFKANAVLLNGEKCQFLLIESSCTMQNHTAEIKIGDKYVEESKKRKLLGINFDNNLTMVDHIKYMCVNRPVLSISHFLNDHKRKILM